MAADSSIPLSVQLAHTLRGHTSDVNTVIFSPIHSAAPLLASCASDKTIRLWNFNDKNDSTAKYMASVSTDGTCLLWDLTTISVLKEYKHDSGSPIRVCQFSSDGVLLATG
jgi:WD40 repeat protein